MLNRNFLDNTVRAMLLVAGALSAFNFYKFPLFHAVTVLALLVVIFNIILRKMRFSVLRDNVFFMGAFFILLSIPSYLISVYFTLTLVSLTYFYFVVFFTTFLFINKNLDEAFFVSLLKYVLFSSLLITICGWLIRVGFLRIDYFSDDAIISEFLLGYWGIRYSPSTRNADYLYPLLGSAIALYFYIKTKKIGYFMVVVFFNYTMIFSLSRAALILSVLSFLVVFLALRRGLMISSCIFILMSIGFNYEFLISIYHSVFSPIMSSIFSLESSELKYSNTERLVIYFEALRAGLLNPLGYGIDNYKIIFDIFRLEGKIKASAESAFLTILVELGLGNSF